MPYEIDFLPVGEGKSGDAIALRYQVANGFEVLIVDGGTEASGEALVEHVQKVYQTNRVEHVVCTHPDNDHASGLRVVLGGLRVGTLWTHVPWLHASETRRMFTNENWTDERLATTIKLGYPMIEELINLAQLQNTRVVLPFQGERIGPFVVAAPTRARYNRLLPQFRDTPAPDELTLRRLGEWIVGLGQRTARAIRMAVQERRDLETLREGGVASAENESSVVLYGDFPSETSALLTADAGLQALDESIRYLRTIGADLNRLGVLQIPHHGSRNNIAPSILNRLIGQPLPAGEKRAVEAFVSASLKDEDHPRQIVVNAFDRRGVTVYPTHGKQLMRCSGVPLRQGWVRAAILPFSPNVEEYD